MTAAKFIEDRHGSCWEYTHQMILDEMQAYADKVKLEHTIEALDLLYIHIEDQYDTRSVLNTKNQFQKQLEQYQKQLEQLSKITAEEKAKELMLGFSNKNRAIRYAEEQWIYTNARDYWAKVIEQLKTK